ncbi:TPA: ATP-binding protein [Providencia alcalifaciens]|nr:ATP-binding protein [Providencia alcalifaciens]
MSIKKTLEDRKDSEAAQDLYKAACEIEKFVDGHLKRIFQVLTEFDVHDISHSHKVIKNIELLLGREKIESLTSFELFFLLTSSLLHDCAMAPAEWELKLMEMTEGNEQYFDNEKSIKNDLKQPYTHKKSILFIDEIWNLLDIKLDWLFCPDNNEELKKELSSLFIEYQIFRNGFKESYENISSNEDFSNLNKKIRIEFIRKNHFLRIEKYVKNLSKKINNFITPPNWGKKIANDLATICRSHGENLEYILELDKEAHYYEDSTSNLQFISIMLRLGDIIHYSFDRAPTSISNAKNFESDYSFNEWSIKNNGVTYDINNGRISFKAYCTNPHDYFKLHRYLDYIDQEIQNYFTLSRQWKKSYEINLNEKINRDGIANDKDEFLPIRNLKFKLDQKKIIELLMGVGLYKSEYACLRELYQNSLDACRTLKASFSESIRSTDLKIEFGLERIGNDVYLYCHDNGIGMDENIIENYLLNIGNSYYKSSIFYREQANNSYSFTPTSQFGIGILSCFMLGDRIDITTKKIGHDLISCSIEGPHENFYYRKSDIDEKEAIGTSGTKVRILLNDDFKKKLHSNHFKNIELANITSASIHDASYLPEQFSEYNALFQKFENNLQFIIDGFLISPIDDIKVNIKIENSEEVIEIKKKPYPFNYLKSNLNSHIEFINFITNDRLEHKNNNQLYTDIIKDTIQYIINTEYNGIILRTVIILPKNTYSSDSHRNLSLIPIIGYHTISIDGVNVEEYDFDFRSPIEKCSFIGSLNFTGKIRPQLSVDRISITNTPYELEKQCKVLFNNAINNIIEQVETHTLDEKLNDENFSHCIFHLFHLLDFDNLNIINKILPRKLSTRSLNVLRNITPNEHSIKSFIESKKITISHPNKSRSTNRDTIDNYFLNRIITAKVLKSKEIIVNDDTIEITSYPYNELGSLDVEDENDYNFGYSNEIFQSTSWNIKNPEYDIISSAIPFISENLYKSIIKNGSHKKNRYIKFKRHQTNLFSLFHQNPQLIHPIMGIYYNESNYHNEFSQSCIFNFDSKYPRITLDEINGNSDKDIIMVYIFISPWDISDDDQNQLCKLDKSEFEYIKGVKEGWSILITGMHENNLVIKAGYNPRESLLDMLPDDFWNIYSNYNFTFTDGTPAMKKNNNLPS